MDLEHRKAVEWRAAGRRLVGLAAPFDSPADLGGGIVEVIRKGAFAKALGSGADIVALIDHDPGRLLARTRSRTLRLGEGARGLDFEIDLPETRDAEDLLALAARGDLGGASFGFKVPKGGERWQGNQRELLQIDLREISIVHSWPAYTDTSVAARARLDGETRRQLAMMRRYMETV